MSHATSVASHRPPAKAKGGFVFNLCAAAASSSLHTSIAYPLHRVGGVPGRCLHACTASRLLCMQVKSLLQTQDALPAVSSGRIARFTFANAFSRIVKEQGVLSLWWVGGTQLAWRQPDTRADSDLARVVGSVASCKMQLHHMSYAPVSRWPGTGAARTLSTPFRLPRPPPLPT